MEICLISLQFFFWTQFLWNTRQEKENWEIKSKEEEGINRFTFIILFNGIGVLCTACDVYKHLS